MNGTEPRARNEFHTFELAVDASLRLGHARVSRAGRSVWRAVAAAIVVVAAGCDLGGSVDCSDFRVDRGAWAEAVPGEQGSARDKIADGLVECRVLRGASRNEVARLLGRPEQVSRRPEAWIYTLGPERRMIKMNPGYLMVTFDTRDRVRAVEIF